MRTLLMLALLSVTACNQKESKSSGGQPPAAPEPVAAPPPVAAAGSSAPTESTPPRDDASEVAQRVVHDVGSNAFGNQKIEASCVSVIIMPSGDWTVAAARLKDCGDKTARSILWLYKRGKTGTWNEDYLGQPPRCWKGVPADIVDAVTKATKIPAC
jgi:hypothetical protein